MIPAYSSYRPGQFLTSAGLSAGLSADDDACDSATLDAGGGDLNQFGQFAFSEAAVAGWAQEAAFAAEDYARRRNAELAQNPTSGMDAAADLPPNR
jgi:hypothetical protein